MHANNSHVILLCNRQSEPDVQNWYFRVLCQFSCQVPEMNLQGVIKRNDLKVYTKALLKLSKTFATLGEKCCNEEHSL
jgi:hypothetical protein